MPSDIEKLSAAIANLAKAKEVGDTEAASTNVKARNRTLQPDAPSADHSIQSRSPDAAHAKRAFYTYAPWIGTGIGGALGAGVGLASGEQAGRLFGPIGVGTLGLLGGLLYDNYKASQDLKKRKKPAPKVEEEPEEKTAGVYGDKRKDPAGIASMRDKLKKQVPSAVKEFDRKGEELNNSTKTPQGQARTLGGYVPQDLTKKTAMFDHNKVPDELVKTANILEMIHNNPVRSGALAGTALGAGIGGARGLFDDESEEPWYSRLGEGALKGGITGGVTGAGMGTTYGLGGVIGQYQGRSDTLELIKKLIADNDQFNFGRPLQDYPGLKMLLDK